MHKSTFLLAGALAVSSAFWACGSDEGAVKEAENDVFALHDEVMPRMDDVMKLRKQLKQRMAALDSVKGNRISDGRPPYERRKEQALLLSRNLNKADSLMMGWMSHYNGDTLAQLSSEEALKYLTEQKDQIIDVKKKVNSSIEQTKQFLAKK